jgi:hypothetical protein
MFSRYVEGEEDPSIFRCRVKPINYSVYDFFFSPPISRHPVSIGVMLGGHVRAVFTLVTFIFIACVIVTLYSFSEIPLDVLSDTSNIDMVNVCKLFFLQTHTL